MLSSDLQILCKRVLKYPRNPLIGDLNINVFRNKTIDVGEIIGRLQLDYFVISETKLVYSFASTQFRREDYVTRKIKMRVGLLNL